MKEIRPELIKNKKHKLWAEDVKTYVSDASPFRSLALSNDMFDFIWQHVKENYDDEHVNEFEYNKVRIVRMRR